jgi:BlaI family transcriptional regulator, penicillinase repressor
MENGKEQKSAKAEPTKAELEILRVLWEHGPSTVRFVYDQLSSTRDIIYTSTLKVMQNMTDKGLLKRDERNMKHIYHVVEEESTTKGFLLDQFVNTLFKGSASGLVMQLLDNDATSKEDLQVIRQLLDELESKNKKS